MLLTCASVVLEEVLGSDASLSPRRCWAPLTPSPWRRFWAPPPATAVGWVNMESQVWRPLSMRGGGVGLLLRRGGLDKSETWKWMLLTLGSSVHPWRRCWAPPATAVHWVNVPTQVCIFELVLPFCRNLFFLTGSTLTLFGLGWPDFCSKLMIFLDSVLLLLLRDLSEVKNRYNIPSTSPNNPTEQRMNTNLLSVDFSSCCLASFFNLLPGGFSSCLASSFAFSFVLQFWKLGEVSVFFFLGYKYLLPTQDWRYENRNIIFYWKLGEVSVFSWLPWKTDKVANLFPAPWVVFKWTDFAPKITSFWFSYRVQEVGVV